MTIISVNEFRDYFRSEVTADEAFIDRALDATDSGIHEFCQRTFTVAAEEASARTYVPTRADVLRIHDCTTVTSVVEGGATLTANTGYVVEPVQTVSWSGEVRPYTQVRRLGSCWYMNQGLGTVVVTATWGWAAIPAAVKQAALIGAKELIDQREVRFGIAAVNDFGPMRVRANPALERLLAPYVRSEAFGIA